jgi:hypothetical protein
MKSTLIAATLATLVGSAAHAQPANPDNDWASFFAYAVSASAAAPPNGASPKLGDVSTDGQWTYAGGDRGWMHRPHSFELVGGALVHTRDSLPYDLPRPARGMGGTQEGPFADRGA